MCHFYMVCPLEMKGSVPPAQYTTGSVHPRLLLSSSIGRKDHGSNQARPSVGGTLWWVLREDFCQDLLESMPPSDTAQGSSLWPTLHQSSLLWPLKFRLHLGFIGGTRWRRSILHPIDRPNRRTGRGGDRTGLAAR